MKYYLKNDLTAEDLETYQKAGTVAIDTELHGLSLRRDRVCLMQISDREQNLCLINTSTNQCPERLKLLLADQKVTKVFHYALVDVTFIRQSFNVPVNAYVCTKVMSKLCRTYSDGHGLKNLVLEFTGISLDKASQSSDWSSTNLTNDQLAYAAEDVLSLLFVYDKLHEMINKRPSLPTGIQLAELNQLCQNQLPTLVELALNGYSMPSAISDQWNTNVFQY